MIELLINIYMLGFILFLIHLIIFRLKKDLKETIKTFKGETETYRKASEKNKELYDRANFSLQTAPDNLLQFLFFIAFCTTYLIESLLWPYCLIHRVIKKRFI